MFENLSVIVKERRKYLGMTQSQLAEGICSRETISRLESGARRPDASILNGIMHKLGVAQDPGIKSFMSQDELFRNDRIIELNQLAAYQNKDGILEFIDKWSKHASFRKGQKGYPIIKQAQMLIHVMDTNENPESIDKALDIIYEILEIQRPGFRLENLTSYFLSQTEIAMIQNIAIYTGLYKKDWDEAIRIQKLLIESIETKYEKVTGFGKWYYRNMQKDLCLMCIESERYSEALELAEKCIGFFYDGYLAQFSPTYPFYSGMKAKAIALLKTGNKDEGTKQYRKFLMLAYALDGWLGTSFESEMEECRKHLGEELTLGI